jgi:hypothetical protein
MRHEKEVENVLNQAGVAIEGRL